MKVYTRRGGQGTSLSPSTAFEGARRGAGSSAGPLPLRGKTCDQLSEPFKGSAKLERVRGGSFESVRGARESPHRPALL